jgi:hypothetical protein
MIHPGFNVSVETSEKRRLVKREDRKVVGSTAALSSYLFFYCFVTQGETLCTNFQIKKL